jgi:CheY-like chemotaxis protein
MMTDMWRMLFERVAKFEIGIENSGAAVLETARFFRPGLIFMDVCLSGKNGVEVAAELAADPVLKSIPIVFLTGLSKEEAAERRLSDRHMVLTKPANLQAILTCAERFFSLPMLEAS